MCWNIQHTTYTISLILLVLKHYFYQSKGINVFKLPNVCNKNRDFPESRRKKWHKRNVHRKEHEMFVQRQPQHSMQLCNTNFPRQNIKFYQEFGKNGLHTLRIYPYLLPRACHIRSFLPLIFPSFFFCRKKSFIFYCLARIFDMWAFA